MRLLNSVLTFFLIFAKVRSDDPAKDWLPKDLYEDTISSVPEFLARYGYKVENHTVTTEDGYILEVHRLPRKYISTNNTGQPVLMLHGISGASIDFLFRVPNKALGTLMYNNGYDVWLYNARGTYPSRKHVRLNPSNATFWDFSIHEMGKYDIPVIIDLILSKNGANKLHAVTFSQGAPILLAMVAMRPEYNKKIASLNAMAPAVFIGKSSNPQIETILSILPGILSTLRSFGINEFLPKSDQVRILASYLCRPQELTMQLCKLIYSETASYVDLGRLPFYYAHSFAGFSVKQALHFLQWRTSSRFAQYDYGLSENYNRYSSTVPPEYNITNITIPTAIYYAKSDIAVGVESIKKLAKTLPNVIKIESPERETFDHTDFLLTTDVEPIYDMILNVIKKYT